MSEDQKPLATDFPFSEVNTNDTVVASRLAQFVLIYGEPTAQEIYRRAQHAAQAPFPSIEQLSIAAQSFFKDAESSILAQHEAAASYDFSSQPYPIPHDPDIASNDDKSV